MSDPHSSFTMDSLLEHAEWLRRLAGRLVADAHVADDLVQETWLTALRKRPQGERGDAGEGVKGWLARVLRSRLIDRSRADRRREELEHHALPAIEVSRRGLDPAAAAAELEWQHGLANEVLALKPEWRDVVLLRYFRGATPSEIARENGVPLGTVKTRLRRGMHQLRERLDRGYGHEQWLLAFTRWSGEQGGVETAADGARELTGEGRRAALFSGGSILLAASVLAMAGGGIWLWLAGDLAGPAEAGEPRAEIAAAGDGTSTELPSANIGVERVESRDPATAGASAPGAGGRTDPGPPMKGSTGSAALVPLAVRSTPQAEVVARSRSATLRRMLQFRLEDDDEPLAMAFSPDGELLAIGGESGSFLIVRISDGIPLASTRLEFVEASAGWSQARDTELSERYRRGVRGVAFTSDARAVALNGAGRLVELDAETAAVRELAVLGHGVNRMAVAPAADRLAVAAFDGEVRQYRLSDGAFDLQILAGTDLWPCVLSYAQPEHGELTLLVALSDDDPGSSDPRDGLTAYAALTGEHRHSFEHSYGRTNEMGALWDPTTETVLAASLGEKGVRYSLEGTRLGALPPTRPDAQLLSFDGHSLLCDGASELDLVTVDGAAVLTYGINCSLVATAPGRPRLAVNHTTVRRKAPEEIVEATSLGESFARTEWVEVYELELHQQGPRVQHVHALAPGDTSGRVTLEMRLLAHDAEIQDLLVAPTGELVSRDVTGRIVVWSDLGARDPRWRVLPVEAHGSGQRVAFTPEGGLLVTEDATVFEFADLESDEHRAVIVRRDEATARAARELAERTASGRHRDHNGNLRDRDVDLIGPVHIGAILPIARPGSESVTQHWLIGGASTARGMLALVDPETGALIRELAPPDRQDGAIGQLFSHPEQPGSVLTVPKWLSSYRESSPYRWLGLLDSTDWRVLLSVEASFPREPKALFHGDHITIFNQPLLVTFTMNAPAPGAERQLQLVHRHSEVPHGVPAMLTDGTLLIATRNQLQLFSTDPEVSNPQPVVWQGLQPRAATSGLEEGRVLLGLVTGEIVSFELRP